VPSLPLRDERALAAKGARRGTTRTGKNRLTPPRSETHLTRHIQERMPYGLFVPEVNAN
jgi:hypothetical protein